MEVKEEKTPKFTSERESTSNLHSKKDLATNKDQDKSIDLDNIQKDTFELKQHNNLEQKDETEIDNLEQKQEIGNNLEQKDEIVNNLE